jgi:hypothetical protein
VSPVTTTTEKESPELKPVETGHSGIDTAVAREEETPGEVRGVVWE